MDKYYSPNKDDDMEQSHMSFENDQKDHANQMEQRRNSLLPLQN
jgi:hypothetical protein